MQVLLNIALGCVLFFLCLIVLLWNRYLVVRRRKMNGQWQSFSDFVGEEIEDLLGLPHWKENPEDL